MTGDHAALERIFYEAESRGGTEILGRLYRAHTLASAAIALRKARFAVVVCESNLGPETWKDVLSCIQRMTDPPLLIVTSLHADEYLWAEALNLGAYDVLAKPFDAAEVLRTVTLAGLRWHTRQSAGRSLVMQSQADDLLDRRHFEERTPGGDHIGNLVSALSSAHLDVTELESASARMFAASQAGGPS